MKFLFGFLHHMLLLAAFSHNGKGLPKTNASLALVVAIQVVVLLVASAISGAPALGFIVAEVMPIVVMRAFKVPVPYAAAFAMISVITALVALIFPTISKVSLFSLSTAMMMALMFRFNAWDNQNEKR